MFAVKQKKRGEEVKNEWALKECRLISKVSTSVGEKYTVVVWFHRDGNDLITKQLFESKREGAESKKKSLGRWMDT